MDKFFSILALNLRMIDFSDSHNITQFIILFSIFLFLVIAVSLIFKRAFIFIFNCTFFVLLTLSMLFDFETLIPICSSVLLFGNSIFLFSNTGMIRKYVARNLKNEKIKNKVISKADIDKFVDDMVTTVKWLSDNKVGALITFERKMPLNDYIKSGTVLDADFTPELVESIFYEGTRLHDGALIIRDYKIVAGGVFFPSSNSTFIGKFGARHRAAMGICELTDAITIIVSEETGRVAIAHSGIMDNIRLSEFKNIFKNQFINN